MDKKFTSIISELRDYVPYRDRDHAIEARALQVIASFKNLKKLLDETYDPETAEDLFKRLGNAARTGDERKFTRKIKEIREGDTRGKS